MKSSVSEFRHFKSIRVPIQKADDIRFSLEIFDERGNEHFVEDAEILDVSANGLGIRTSSKLDVGEEIRLSLLHKKVNIEVDGKVIRVIHAVGESGKYDYGIEIVQEDQKDIFRFINSLISSFNPDRLKDCLQALVFDSKSNEGEGFEVFSLMLTLFRDITKFGKSNNFIESILEEVVRIFNSQRASVFLINPETNQLEAIAALGGDKNLLKFDYRKGIAGSVFTTGISLNIDSKNDKIRFSLDVDEVTGFDTKSILCSPITNREDKVIGVIQILNKINKDRFSIEDEKIMKMLVLVFSSVFHDYNPVAEKSRVRRFSAPFDRKYTLIGKSKPVDDLRETMAKLKDVDLPLLIQGEAGTGKTLYARILHEEGKRGLNKFSEVECLGATQDTIERTLFGDGEESVLETCLGGTVLIKNIDALSLEDQKRLYHVFKNRRLPESKVSIDTRIITSTAKNIKKQVEEYGSFNRDLFEYISVTKVKIKPLRERLEDLPSLINFFMKRECRRQGYLLKVFAPKVMKKFKEYDWPGNVKELEEAIARVVLYNPKAHIISSIENSVYTIIDMDNNFLGGLNDIEHVTDHNIPLKDRLALVERKMILAEIKRHGGNKTKASNEMGISREALRKKLLQSEKVVEKLEKRGIKDDSDELRRPVLQADLTGKAA